MASSGTQKKVAIDKSGANKAAMDDVNTKREQSIVVRQVKYLKISLSRSTGYHTHHPPYDGLQVIQLYQKYPGKH